MNRNLLHMRMNIQVVEEDLISSQSLENLQPLHHPHTEILQREVHPLDTHSKLGLLSGGQIVDDVEIVGGGLTLLLHQGDSQGSHVGVGGGHRTGDQVGGHWGSWWTQVRRNIYYNSYQSEYSYYDPLLYLCHLPMPWG